MPRIDNHRFMPPNKNEAKDTIFRAALHDTEIDDKMLRRDNLIKAAKMVMSPKDDDKSKIISGLSDPLFASKLDRMERLANASKMSLGLMMYTNKTQQQTSIYDYQKI